MLNRFLGYLCEAAFYALIVVVALAFLVGLSYGQTTPDARGEVVTSEPTYKGETLSAPSPKWSHVRNELDANGKGSGMCTISSVVSAGMSQGVPGFNVAGRGMSNVPDDLRVVENAPGKGSPLWLAAKQENAGGYGPDTLAALIRQEMPGVRYSSFLNADSALCDEFSRKGYSLCMTMNTGKFYNYKPIHHMVNVPHYRQGGMTCVVDNNDPGVFHWLPSDEMDVRREDGGFRWLFLLNYLAVVAGGASHAPIAAVAAAVLFLAAALIVLSYRLRQSQAGSQIL